VRFTRLFTAIFSFRSSLKVNLYSYIQRIRQPWPHSPLQD